MAIVLDDDYKAAFHEEQENLDRVEGCIHALISSEEAGLKNLQKKIDDYYVVDNEDRQNKIYLIEQTNRKQERVNEYTGFIDSPYFGHFIMMEKGGDPIDLVVGKKALSGGSGAESVILDWRSPMGMTFYNKKEHRFCVNGIEYDLLLRRAVDIQEGKLRKVKTEYDSATLSLEGEVIDEFLISVLKDKRRDYKLTDIIRTIQANQNEIIGKPLDESFIVQGCAGSGKTMILLHRLSYIAYNHKGIDFGRFCILTPNEYFNVHVDELSHSLGLDKIKRYTVEGFYSELIKSRGNKDQSIRSGRSVPKITASSTGLKSEKLLNADLLTHIYSNAFFNEICSDYETRAANAAQELQRLGIAEVLKKHGYSAKAATRFDYSAYNYYFTAISDVLSGHSTSFARLGAVREELSAAESKLSVLMAQEDSKRRALIDTRNETVNMCEAQKKALEEQERTEREELRQLTEAIDSAKEEKKKVFETIQRAEASLAIINRSPERVCQFDYLSTAADEIADEIRSACTEQFAQLKDLHAELGSLAIYNFGKRSRIRSAIHDAEKKLALSAAGIVDTYRKEKKEEVERLRNGKIISLDEQITTANARIAALQTGRKVSAAKLNALRNCLNSLLTDQFPDLNRRLVGSEKELLKDLIGAYTQALIAFSKVSRDCYAAKDAKQRLEGEAEKLEHNVLSVEDSTPLARGLDIVQQFDATVLYQSIEDRLKALYSTYGQPYSSTANYRHRIYLKLLLCTLYYGAASNTGYYISIDEAQDLAPAEFRLLRLVLGDKAVFNLYGDVNQSIYEYKGISDWNEVSEIIPSNTYFLNENYRNTRQITDYCNREFGAEVTAIGLNGADVIKEDFSTALDRIEDLHGAFPGYRLAIIYKRGLEGLAPVLDESLKTRHVYDAVDPRAISIITVEEAKGLEFDAVLVVENYMNVNERYISYTRALDNLILTDLPQLSFASAPEDESRDVSPGMEK